jgi:hypothetical protein
MKLTGSDRYVPREAVPIPRAGRVVGVENHTQPPVVGGLPAAAVSLAILLCVLLFDLLAVKGAE